MIKHTLGFDTDERHGKALKWIRRNVDCTDLQGSDMQITFNTSEPIPASLDKRFLKNVLYRSYTRDEVNL